MKFLSVVKDKGSLSVLILCGVLLGCIQIMDTSKPDVSDSKTRYGDFAPLNIGKEWVYASIDSNSNSLGYFDYEKSTIQLNIESKDSVGDSLVFLAKVHEWGHESHNNGLTTPTVQVLIDTAYSIKIIKLKDSIICPEIHRFKFLDKDSVSSSDLKGGYLTQYPAQEADTISLSRSCKNSICDTVLIHSTSWSQTSSPHGGSLTKRKENYKINIGLISAESSDMYSNINTTVSSSSIELTSYRN